MSAAPLNLANARRAAAALDVPDGTVYLVMVASAGGIAFTTNAVTITEARSVAQSFSVSVGDARVAVGIGRDDAEVTYATTLEGWVGR